MVSPSSAALGSAMLSASLFSGTPPPLKVHYFALITEDFNLQLKTVIILDVDHFPLSLAEI
jgi:hypothetical protein